MATATRAKRKPAKRQAVRLTDPDRIELLRTMMRIRRFEIRCRELFLDGAIKGTAHSSVGQEAIAAGACFALREEDFLVSHHRGHGHCIAKGASPARMMAELMGREDGYCRGLGGSMHIADLSLNILGANGVVGAGMGIGVGAALAAWQRQDGSAGIAFFGDGAANEGILHEALNIAEVWRLPILFFCENNQYGLSTASARVTAGEGVAARAAAYGVPGEVIDGNDVAAVFATTERALARARAGEGPSLIEATTYRWDDHSMRANLPSYRSEEEEDDWRTRDPIARLEAALVKKKALSPAAVAEIRTAAEAEIEAAIDFAKASPEPDESIFATAVYAPRPLQAEPSPRLDPERKLTAVEAINEALRQEMARDERVFVIGEDVGGIGGIFGATRGLMEDFGPTRLIDTPISEMGIAGAAVGAAIRGQRPVVEIQIFDFVTLMMDMIVNQAAKFRFMLGGAPTVPIVFRGPQGGGIRLAAQHSQSLEAWFAHVPGLVVVAPATPYDAKGLMAAAIREDNPVVFLEHKLLYLGQAAPVPAEPYVIPIGKAEVKRAGSDVTVVATQLMVERALAAAAQLERDGLSVEVIDPRTLAPLDAETILASVRKTNRLVIAHEAWRRGGIGAEIASVVLEQAFDWLDAPIARVGAPDVPMPYNDNLERKVMPSQADIAAAIRGVCYRD